MKPLTRRDVALFRSCWRKRGFNEKHARALAKVNGQRPYRCGNCKLWHLTKQSGR